jgi:predicted RNase H-like HicB family nuclease
VPRCNASGRTKKEAMDRIEAALGRRLDRLAAQGKPAPLGCCRKAACPA